MSSIFTKIINREISAYIVAEDERYIAFLDVSPNREGHTLVVPKKEINKLFDLDEETYTGLFAFAKNIGSAMEKSFDCNRVGLSVAGLEVPHVHLHLVPINDIEDLSFHRKVSLSEEEMENARDKIIGNLDL